MNLNDDVAYRSRRLQRHPRCSRSVVRHHDRLHGTSRYRGLSFIPDVWRSTEVNRDLPTEPDDI
jgi:hypothetical protein